MTQFLADAQCAMFFKPLQTPHSLIHIYLHAELEFQIFFTSCQIGKFDDGFLFSMTFVTSHFM
jgi:hypothetical protein